MKCSSLTAVILLILIVLMNVGITGCTQITKLISGNKPPNSGEILFSDDFENNQNNWGTMGRTGGTIGIQYGGLVIEVDVANFLFWTTNGTDLSDAQVDVDAVLLEGPVNDNFGVICRYQDNDHFYGFLATHDGYYGIFKMVDGEIILLSGDGSMQYSDKIRQGGTVNHLSAACSGKTLSLTINDQPLAQIEDDDYTTGKVGLIAGTYQDPGAKVFFDQFVVRQP